MKNQGFRFPHCPPKGQVKVQASRSAPKSMAQELDDKMIALDGTPNKRTLDDFHREKGHVSLMTLLNHKI